MAMAEIVFRRLWLTIVVPPNWIIGCGVSVVSEILEVPEIGVVKHTFLVIAHFS